MKKFISFLKSTLLSFNKPAIEYDTNKLTLLTDEEKSGLCLLFGFNSKTEKQVVEDNFNMAEYLYRVMFLGRKDKLNEESWNLLTKLFYVCNPEHKQGDKYLRYYNETDHNEVIFNTDEFHNGWLNVKVFVLENYTRF